MKYLGNKSRLSDFLQEAMTLPDREGQIAFDPFAGTGAVSYLMKKNKINTVSSDLLYFSSCRTKAILLDTAPKNLSDYLDHTTEEGFVTNNYSEKCGVNIFRRSISNHIDGARSFLEQEKTNLSVEDFFYYLSQVVEAADFRSNIMGSYESFYKKGWRKQCDYTWKVEQFELIDNKGVTEHRVFNKNWRDVFSDLDHRFDFVYLDPPYNTRQYCSVAHVLETIAVHDNPRVSGAIRKSVTCGQKKSNFSSKIKCKDEFSDLIEQCSKVTNEVFLSYSNEGIMKEEDILKTLKSNFKNVVKHTQDYRRFKTNSKNKTTKNKVEEHLYHASK